ncbi:UDP-N-acetylgalactosamine-undecaprenyl-phosphate N-acetylgalactosaminephosphotransferase [compost metagenome]
MATIAAISVGKTQPSAARFAFKKRTIRAVAFMLIDGLLAFAALSVGSALAGGYTPLMNGALGSLIVPLSYIAVKVYDQGRAWSRWQVLYECLKGSAVAVITLGLLAFLIPELSLSIHRLGIGLVVAVALTVAWRLLTFNTFSALPERRVLILSQDDLACSVTNELLSRDHLGYRLVQVSTDSILGDTNTAVLAPRDLFDSKVDIVAVSPVSTVSLETRDLLVNYVERGVAIVSLLSVYEDLMQRVPVRFLNESWFAEVTEQHQRKEYDLSKRILDLTVAVIGLLLTGLLLPFIAAAILIAGGQGPLIYSQVRVGLNGRNFTIYKFRSMAVDAEKNGPLWASQNDVRITTVGRLLRQTRLDELPQFWNVLKGEMSVVGPRPERPEFVTALNETIPYYSRRHDVLPGLTGWAQVKFPYGASVEDSFEKLQYDLFYLKHRSFYLDLKVMVKTISVMARKIGAR